MFEWLSAQVTPEQWEALRNWLATLGGLAALLIATNTYRRNVKGKREEQARLVYAKVIDFKGSHAPGTDLMSPLSNGARLGVSPSIKRKPIPPGTGSGIQLLMPKWETTEPAVEVTIALHNGSKELIGPARVQLIDNDVMIDVYSAQIEAIDPESEFVVHFIVPNPHHPGVNVFQPTVIFRDASGQWWRRHRSEPIERVHKDPENKGPTAVERIAVRESQRTMGVPQDLWIEEPKLTLVVRWHRLWRLVRGKPALP